VVLRVAKSAFRCVLRRQNVRLSVVVLVKADLRNVQVLVAIESTDYDEWGPLVVVMCD
jgi:hypothetical protein